MTVVLGPEMMPYKLFLALAMRTAVGMSADRQMAKPSLFSLEVSDRGGSKSHYDIGKHTKWGQKQVLGGEGTMDRRFLMFSMDIQGV